MVSKQAATTYAFEMSRISSICMPCQDSRGVFAFFMMKKIFWNDFQPKYNQIQITVLSFKCIIIIFLFYFIFLQRTGGIYRIYMLEK